MIIGVHAMIYTKDAEADRAFLRDVLGFKHVDVGGGWLIFALPPAEVGVHPSDENNVHELYLMTDDVDAEIERLTKAGHACDPVSVEGYGRVTAVALPGGGKLGLYQPTHELAPH
jgi:catechol 2,3-dioxygenase-like lactoylglutathione lyase family enzyme